MFENENNELREHLVAINRVNEINEYNSTLKCDRIFDCYFLS